MSFATFQTLPDHNLNIPEFRPAPVPAPPVYNTSETIAPLLKLAQYLSPSERAKRKALIARANYEYRLYSSGDPRAVKDPLFWLKVKKMRAETAAKEAYAKKLNKSGTGPSMHPTVAPRFKRDFGKDFPNTSIDYESESTPPPPQEENESMPESTMDENEASETE